MRAKARVAIVGAGKLGTALAVALRRAGYAIDAVISRPGTASLKKARVLAEQVGARAVINLCGVSADVIWFCVPDREIAVAAEALSQDHRALARNAGRTGHSGFSWDGKIALHSSGALASDELGVLLERGAVVGSAHPMMTFVRGSRPALAGVSFAVEGDAGAMRVARQVVKDLGGIAHSIGKQDKAAYHAWGTFASPLLTALLATTEEVAGLAGVSRGAARKRMTPILMQTLANYAEFGAARGFSGPIVRGDIETVHQHLRALRDAPEIRDVYVALAKAALKYLPAKNRKELAQLLRF